MEQTAQVQSKGTPLWRLLLYGVAGFIALIVVGVLYAAMKSRDGANYSASSLSSIEDQVAADAVAQYEIAKRQGDKMQTCVQAGMVSAAFLQAKNEAKYGEWKDIEKADCARAGLPVE